MAVITLGQRQIETDAKGYLLEVDDWNEALADHMAEQDGVTLLPAHWEIIWFLRQYYAEFQMAPPMRLLVKAIAQRVGSKQGDSRYLYRLFPQGPAKQACRYAGLPKPVSCI